MGEKVAVVLAAGKGTRMKTDLPKVLVEVCGRPMIEFVLDALVAASVDRTIVVVGHRAERVRAALAGWKGVQFALQAQQLGTGHAVMVCRHLLAGHDGPVVIVAGDSPMIRSDSIVQLLAEFERQPPACIIGTTHKANPTGLGRIVRSRHGDFLAIIEEKDATDRQRRITEVNMSCYVFNGRDLLESLDQIQPANAQGEYYLTDCPGALKTAGKEVRALDVLRPCEGLSINTREELATVEAAMAQTGTG